MLYGLPEGLALIFGWFALLFPPFTRTYHVIKYFKKNYIEGTIEYSNETQNILRCDAIKILIVMLENLKSAIVDTVTIILTLPFSLVPTRLSQFMCFC